MQSARLLSPAQRSGILMLCGLLSFGLASCRQTPQEAEPVSIEQVKADLQTIATVRIYFGHQSVGRNILDGVRALSETTGVPLRIVEVQGAAPSGKGYGLFHANLGTNGAPDTKLRDFVAGVASTATAYDLALFKFCYVDLEDGSEEKSPQALFQRYESTMARLGGQLPDLQIVHATMPLTAEPPGWKTWLKRQLGRATWTDDANRRRGEYNEQVRSRLLPEETFDVARLESVRADGSVSAFAAGAKRVETMAAEYTDDGGHLNEQGRRKVAAEFLHTLAQAVRRQEVSRQAAAMSGTDR